MTKDAISDFSVTANSNTDIIGVNIDEGCPPSSLNNGIRALMKTLADLNAGNSSLGKLKVDNLQLDANAITSTDTNGNITITPHGTGSVVIDGLTHPQADGSAGQLLKTNGSGVLSFVTGYAHPNHSGQVTSTADGATVIADNAVTLAKMASGTDGNLISYDTSGNPVAVATGSAGQVLTSAGAGAVPSFATPAGALNYVAVTGATPSLNVGSYNFFENGTLNANTTVSFTNVPTVARWEYSFTAGVGAGFNISSIIFEASTNVNNASASGPQASDTQHSDIFIKPDGTKFYVANGSGDGIYEYTMTTPFDLTTANYNDGHNLNVGSTTNAFTMSYDGTKVYSAKNGAVVTQFTLSTAWDLSTAGSATTHTFSPGPAGGNMYYNMSISPDGTKMYLGGNGSSQGHVWQFTLSSAHSITSESYASKVIDLGSY